MIAKPQSQAAKRPFSTEMVLRVLLMGVVVAGMLALGHTGRSYLANAGGRGADHNKIRVVLGEDARAVMPDVPLPKGAIPLGMITGGSRRGPQLSSRFRMPGGMNQTLAFFRREMPKAGWRPLKLSAATADEEATLLHYSNRGGNSCNIVVSKGSDGEVTASIIRIPVIRKRRIRTKD